MIYDKAFFDRGIDRRGTNCFKWDNTDANAPGAVPLWVADMDFPCPDEIVDGMARRLRHPCYGYTFDGEEGFEAFRDHWKTRHAVEFRKEDTLMLPCVVTGLKAAVQVYTRPGDGVIIMDPVYGPFEKSVTLNGRVPKYCTLRRDSAGRYQMDLDRVESCLKEGVRLILFCNPHNPVSRLWSPEEVGSLIDLAARYGAVLVSDEIHADFVYAPGKFTSAMRFEKFRECGVALCAASKTFNIAGLLQAQAVFGNERLRTAMEDDLTANGVMAGKIFAMAATASAYRYGGKYLDALLDYLKDNRDRVTAWCAEELPDALLSPVEATYLAWLDLRAYSGSEEELKDRFRECGVSLTMGIFFGKPYEGFARLNFGCPRTQLDLGLSRLRDALRR